MIERMKSKPRLKGENALQNCYSALFINFDEEN